MTRFILILFLCSSAFAAQSLSLESLIGRKILVGFQGKTLSDPEPRKLIQLIRQQKIGGVIFYAHNIESPAQLQTLTRQFLEAADFPLILALDQEGGEIQRLNSKNGFEDFPSPGAVAKSLSLREAEALYFRMALLLKSMNFNLNLAPGIDLALSPLFLSRSFSVKPETVSFYAEAFIRAHLKAGVLTVLKHYPGHGSATTDPHINPTDITEKWTLKEESPFLRLIAKKLVSCVMVGHLWNRKWDSEWPASLSSFYVRRIRAKGFNGILMTDDLLMKGLQPLSLNQRILQACLAGQDLLLFGKLTEQGVLIPEKVPEILIPVIQNKKKRIQELEDSARKIARIFFHS